MKKTPIGNKHYDDIRCLKCLGNEPMFLAEELGYPLCPNCLEVVE